MQVGQGYPQYNSNSTYIDPTWIQNLMDLSHMGPNSKLRLQICRFTARQLWMQPDKTRITHKKWQNLVLKCVRLQNKQLIGHAPASAPLAIGYSGWCRSTRTPEIIGKKPMQVYQDLFYLRAYCRYKTKSCISECGACKARWSPCSPPMGPALSSTVCGPLSF